MSTVDLQLPQRAAAWENFFKGFGANVAVTFAYNPVSGATDVVRGRKTAQGTRIPRPVVDATDTLDPHQPRTVRTISLNRVHSDLDWFDYWIGRALCGPQFTKAGERRPAWIGYVENLDTNTHVHALFKMPDDLVDEFTEYASSLWTRRCKSGSIRIKLIWSDGWAHYVTMDQWGMALEGDPGLFVCNRART